MRIAGKVLLLSACLAAAQTPPAASGHLESIAPLVKQQFGESFTLPAKFPTVLITADFDGDGVEDVAIVADSKDPLPDSYDFKYVVADPYNTFFGFGEPRMTASYGRNDPGHNHDLLVIMGSGPEAWRAATPKAKFVLINVPFDSIEVGRVLLKKNKPPIFAIRAIESRLMDSNVYWDAKKKKWKWQPGEAIE
jgi:hypothetical protein